LAFRVRALLLGYFFESVDHAIPLIKIVEGPVLDDLVVGLPSRQLVGAHSKDGPLDVVRDV
jgi:hypothetical protein